MNSFPELHETFSYVFIPHFNLFFSPLPPRKQSAEGLKKLADILREIGVEQCICVSRKT